MYKVIKVLNNNTILATKDEEEVIIMYKGIGFSKKPGFLFEVPASAKKYLMQKNYAEIIKLAAQRFAEVDQDILIPLADHIYFCIQRMKDDIMPLNPFTQDIRLLFPDEYEVALQGRDVIKKFISQTINNDEVGFITLHIHSAISSNKVSETLEATRIIHDGIIKLQTDLNIKIDVESISYVRLLNHIKFLILRINKNEKLQMDISEFTKEKFPFAYEQACYMCDNLSKALNKPLPESEVGYLALHLERILSSTVMNNK